MNFVALYRGGTLSDAQVVAISSDPGVVADLADRLLSQETTPNDPALHALGVGRESALRVIRDDARGGNSVDRSAQ